MTKQEQLLEDYEDAFFALLMDRVAEMEAEKARQENEALKQDPNAAIPADIDRTCRKTIRRTFRAEHSRSARRTAGKIIRKAALIAFLAALLVNAAFAVFPEFRVRTLNMMMDTFNGGVSFGFSSDYVPTPMEDVKPAYVPEGFELIEEGNFNGDIWARYCTAQGDRLQISLSDNGLFDSEGATIEWIEIHGLPACVIDQSNVAGDARGKIKIIVTNEDEGYILSVRFLPHFSDDAPIIDKEELIAIAESIFESE